jgi:hypothetical protein
VAGECTEGPSSPFLGIPCDAAPSTANGRRRSGRYPGLPAYDLPIWKALVVGAIPAVAVRMIAVTFSLDPGPASQYARCIALERWDDTAGRWRLIRDPAESNVSLRGRLAWPGLAWPCTPSPPSLSRIRADVGQRCSSSLSLSFLLICSLSHLCPPLSSHC